MYPNETPERIREMQQREIESYQIEGMEDVYRIVDLGANVGHFVEYAHTLYPAAVIDAFEPDPVNYERLRTLPCNAYNVAVSRRSGEARFDATGDEASHLTAAGENVPPTNEITVMTMAAPLALSGPPIDILKIDTEGAEVEILLSTPHDIMKDVRYIALEFHPWNENRRYDVIMKLCRTHDVEVVRRGVYADIWRCKRLP